MILVILNEVKYPIKRDGASMGFLSRILGIGMTKQASQSPLTPKGGMVKLKYKRKHKNQIQKKLREPET